MGAPAIRHSSALPHYQAPKHYAPLKLCFNFSFFAMRKTHCVICAKALAVLSGRFRTMAVCALVLPNQTGRIERFARNFCFGRKVWDPATGLDVFG